MVTSLNRFQSAPRVKRKFEWRLAGLVQSCGALQEEIPVAGGDDPGRELRAKTSPSRNARPSNPPKLARKSVERLPRPTGTSIPPVISSPAAPSSFPTSRFATRNANESSAPLVEIPNWRNPVRPRSCTEVRKPARVTIAVISTEVEGATQPRQAARPGFQSRCVIVKLAHRDP